MHFLIHKDIRQNRTVRGLLGGYLLAVLAFLILQPFYENAQLGIFPANIAARILGSKELFLEARSLNDLVVDVHVKLFLHIMIGLILSSLLTRTKLRRETSGFLISILFTFPLLESASVFAVSYGGPVWSHLKSILFLSLWLIQFGTTSYLLAFVFRLRKR